MRDDGRVVRALQVRVEVHVFPTRRVLVGLQIENVILNYACTVENVMGKESYNDCVETWIFNTGTSK